MESRRQLMSQQDGSIGRDDPERRRLTQDEMTEDEQRVLNECRRESILFRGLPLALGCMLGALSNPSTRSLPIIAQFGFLGYIIGNISYIPTCRQKIFDQIPNSELAKRLRRRSDQKPPGNENTMKQWETQPLPRSKDDYDFSQAPQGDIFEAQPPAGIDDDRPSADNNAESKSNNENKPKEEKKRTTYEELRRRNRQQYEENQAKQAPNSSSPPPKESPRRPQEPESRESRDNDFGTGSGDAWDQPPPPPPRGPAKKKRTNIWGDVIEDA